MKKILLILALLALVPATGSATELVFNGGFETGTLEGWNTSGEVTVGTAGFWDVNPYHGTYMAVLSPYGFLDSGIAQNIDFAGSTSATVSFAYKLGALDVMIGDPGTDKLQVFLGTNLIYEKTIDDALFGGTTTTPWTPVSYVVPTEWLGESMNFVFFNENVAPGDPFQNTVAFIDDVSVTVPGATVPDPSSSLLLLGMGLSGLAGAARLRLRK